MTHPSNIDCKVIIPARFQSSRFPGKPLTPILGVPMIKRVWDQCAKATSNENIFVATDSDKILNYCTDNNIQVLITSENCLTGTDRIYEASLQIDADIYINVQGDEPLIDPDDIRKIISISKSAPEIILNGMCKITSEVDFRSTAIPKVVTDLNNKLLYMSRAPIPLSKNNEFLSAYKQVCIYAFPKDALVRFAEESKKTPIEDIEDIEILRFLEIGIPVTMVQVSQSSIAVDYPEDVKKVENVLQGNQ